MKVDTQGFLTRLAGDSRPGYTGDGGSALNARVGNPTGIVADVRGNVYFADTFCDCVRKVDASGTITTVVGTGTAGFSGDGGPAVNAMLNQPMGLAVDPTGVLFIADQQNHVIRKVTADGVISTIAGTGNAAFSGDGGASNRASLSSPWDVALDSSGTLYIADTGNNRVRKIVDGVISTLAGNGTQGFNGDSLPATSVFLNGPTAVAVDPSSGLVFLADGGNKRIRAVDPNSGSIGTLAGSDYGPPPLIGHTAQGSPLPGLSGIVVDNFGNLYFVQGRSNTGLLWKILPNDMLALAAGSGSLNYSGDGGPAVIAQLSEPACVATDAAGNLYIADTLNARVRKVSPNGLITTVAGNGDTVTSGDGGLATRAGLYPTCVASDRYGNLFIADTQNSVVRSVAAVDGSITTIAGNGMGGNAPDGVPATVAGISPSGVALDSDGNLYITDNVFNVILKVTSDGIIHNLAGGPTSKIKLAYPHGIVVDADKNVYVADTSDGRIVKISEGGGMTVLAGQGTSGSGDGGPATSARLRAPWGLARDSDGNIYFSDGPQIRKIDNNGILTTVAGSSRPGYSGDGGFAAEARLITPLGLALDASGNLYVADAQANAVRMIGAQTSTPGTVAPPAIKLVANAASNQVGPVAPGEMLVIYGSALGPSTTIRNQADIYGVYGVQAGGASVLFNGRPAPMVYSSTSQVSAVAPYDLAGSSVEISVLYQGAISEPVTASIADSNPAIFSADGSGHGQAAALNQDGSVNGPDTPAPIGSVVVLFSTGEGQTNPRGIDGARTGSSPPKPIFPVGVTIGGLESQILFAAEAPGEVAGIMQVQVVVPSGIQPGNVPVVLQIGSEVSPPVVTIAVSQQ